MVKCVLTHYFLNLLKVKFDYVCGIGWSTFVSLMGKYDRTKYNIRNHTSKFLRGLVKFRGMMSFLVCCCSISVVVALFPFSFSSFSREMEERNGLKIELVELLICVIVVSSWFWLSLTMDFPGSYHHGLKGRSSRLIWIPRVDSSSGWPLSSTY